MNLNNYLGRVHAGVSTLLVISLIVMPALYLPMGLADPQGAPRVALILPLGWAFIFVVQIGRAAKGQLLFGASSSSLSRRLFFTLFIWALITGMTGLGSELSLSWALAGGTFLLVAQSLLDWLEGRPERRIVVIASLTCLLAIQTLFGVIQLIGLSFGGIAYAIPLPLSASGEPNAIALAIREGLLLLSLHESIRPSGTLLVPVRFAELCLLTVPFLAAIGWNTVRPWRRIAMGIALLVPMALLVSVLFKGPTIGSVIESRLPGWQEATMLWLEHPITGVGLGWHQLLASDGPLNLPLQTAVDLGAIGLALAIAAFVCWFRETWFNDSWSQAQRIGLSIGVIALLISACLGSPVASPIVGVAAVILLALGLSRVDVPYRREMSDTMRDGYALLTAVIIGFLGLATIYLVGRPMLDASRFDYAAQALADNGKYPEEAVVLKLAERHQRFKGDVRYARIKNLINQNQFEEALELFAASEREGIGHDAFTLKASALRGLKRFDEAQAACESVLKQFGSNTAQHKTAAEELSLIQRDRAKAQNTVRS